MIRVLSILCLLFVLATLVAGDQPAPGVQWLGSPTDPIRMTPLDPPAEDATAAATLLAPEWHRPVPDIEVDLLEGGTFKFSEARGSVLILDFWASWCGPCARELPHLVAMYEKNRERGLMALTINSQEPPSVARAFAEDIGLYLPIGKYDPRIDAAFKVTSLPALMLVDRDGRMRHRWDAYEDGMEKEVEERLDELLVESGPAPGISVGEIHEGAGTLEVLWMREAPAWIQGVAVIPDEDGDPSILASFGHVMMRFASDGTAGRRWKSPGTAAGTLRRGPLRTDGTYSLVGFRPGSQRLTIFEMPQGDFENLEAPAPVLNAGILDARVLAATVQGLFVSTKDGTLVPTIIDTGVADLAVVEAGSEARVLALETAGRLSELDGTLESVGQREIGPTGFRLVADPLDVGSIGVAPPAVALSAIGSFLGGEGRQAAIYTKSGQLLLADTRSGEVHFRADWPGVTDLAVGDLVGDERDELILVLGRRLAVMRSAEAKTNRHSDSAKNAQK